MTMRARYAGTCATCGRRFPEGAEIEWSKDTKKATHVQCAPGYAEKQKTLSEAIEESRRAACDIAIPVPDGLSYLPYQRAGIDFASKRRATLIADEMGLGKTIQAVGLINHCERTQAMDRILIVCPASLRLNWKREMERWLVTERSIEIATTTYFPETDIVIVGWDSVAKVRAKIDARAWSLVVVDEAHFGKNPTSQRSKAVFGREARGRGDKKVEADLGIRADRKVALTGTPITNRPAELHPVLRWLDQATWPKFFPFGVRYCAGHEGKWGWDFTGASNLGELQQKLRSTVMVRRLKADVLKELPPKQRQIVTIEADEEQVMAVRAEARAWKQHEDSIDGLRAEAELAKAADYDEAYETAAARLRQAVQVAFTEISLLRHETALAKVPAVVEHLGNVLESVDKVVVMAHHHDVIAAIRKAVEEYNPVVLTGETPMLDRQCAVDEFQTNPNVHVFIGSITAAGVGLTLTAASTVIFAELDWVPGNVTQAEDRCHRIGQSNSVLVQHLVLDGSLDARMVKVLVAKQDIADRALDNQSEAKVANMPAVPGEAAATDNVGRKQLDAVALSLSTKEIQTIHTGLKMLAGMCDGARNLDGAGFSKIDVTIGHSLAGAPKLSPRQAALGQKLIRKYRRQLPPEITEVAA